MTSANITDLLAALQGQETLLCQAVRDRRIESYLVEHGNNLVISAVHVMDGPYSFRLI
jgi:hypothetical protein